MTDVLHPGDVLSDLLDGRLTAEDAAAVRAHVLVCAECTVELDAVRDARAAVRSLPAVEPPPGFFEALLAQPEPATSSRLAAVLPFRRTAAVANAAAAVAAGLLLVLGGAGHIAQSVSPQVAGAVEQHAATISAVSAGLGGADPLLGPDEVSPTTLPHRSPSDVPRPYVAPDELGGYRLADAFRSPHGVYLLYEKDGYALSLFEQEGRVDFERLPVPGERLTIGGDDAWRWTGPRADGRVVVLQRDGVAITLVGDESAAAVLAAAKDLPDGTRTLPLVARLRRACGDALDALSPAG